MIALSRVNTCTAKDGPARGRQWESYGIEVRKVITINGEEYRYRFNGGPAGGPLEYSYDAPELTDVPGPQPG